MADFTLTRGVLGAAHIAVPEKEAYRRALSHIWIRDGHVEAADGFVMARVKPSTDIEGVETHIPRSEAIMALRKTTPNRTGVVIQADDEKVRMASEHRPGEIIESDVLSEAEVTFPQLGELIKDEVPKATITLSRTLLKKVLKSVDAAVHSKTPDDSLEFRFFGQNEGVQIRVKSEDGDEITYVVMPMMQNGWKFDDPGVPHTGLLDHHIRQAILDGRAGAAAAELERARIRAEENDEADPNLSEHELRWASLSTIEEAVDKRIKRDTIEEAMRAADIPEDVIEKAMDVVVGHQMKAGVA